MFYLLKKILLARNIDLLVIVISETSKIALRKDFHSELTIFVISFFMHHLQRQYNILSENS